MIEKQIGDSDFSMTNTLKCIIAIAASAYGSLYLLGIGLAGTGKVSLSQPLFFVLGISLAAGIAIALLPKTSLLPSLTAASIPASYLTFLILVGFIEKRDIMSLFWLGMPIGIVTLIILPEAIKTYLPRPKAEPREKTSQPGGSENA